VVLVYIGDWVNLVFRALWYWYGMWPGVAYLLGRCGTGIYWGLCIVVVRALW
jgi:hypothetical protein